MKTPCPIQASCQLGGDMKQAYSRRSCSCTITRCGDAFPAPSELYCSLFEAQTFAEQSDTEGPVFCRTAKKEYCYLGCETCCDIYTIWDKRPCWSFAEKFQQPQTHLIEELIHTILFSLARSVVPSSSCTPQNVAHIQLTKSVSRIELYRPYHY